MVDDDHDTLIDYDDDDDDVDDADLPQAPLQVMLLLLQLLDPLLVAQLHPDHDDIVILSL